MYLFQYNLLKSRFGSNIMFLHIWTVILMYDVYGNKIIVIVIIVSQFTSMCDYSLLVQVLSSVI